MEYESRLWEVEIILGLVLFLYEYTSFASIIDIEYFLRFRFARGNVYFFIFVTNVTLYQQFENFKPTYTCKFICTFNKS